jgi:putative two-component system response regulator
VTSNGATKQARILLVDDEAANVRVLERLLQHAGYGNARGVTDARQVLSVFGTWDPHLVVLDLHMPHLDGYQVLAQLKAAVGPEAYLPILVITADVTTEAKRQALSAGATDFLTKPFDAVEVALRASNLLHTGALHQKVLEQNRILQDTLDQKVKELAALNRFMQPFLERRSEDEDAVRWLQREMAEATRRIATLMQRAQEQRAALEG